MKKFSLLLCLCLTALMVPQRVLATVTPTWDATNKVLTIETDGAGQLTRSAFESYYGAKKIVLKGYFNSADLEAIEANSNSGDNVADGFNDVREVDMSEAYFVQAGSSSNLYQLFKGSASGTGTQGIVDGTLYQWVNTKGWNPSQPPAEGSSVSDYPSDLGDKNIGDYGKSRNGDRYIQMHITGDRWDGPVNTAPATSYTSVSWREDELGAHKKDYINGDKIEVKRYYHKESFSPSHWVQVYPKTSPSAFNGNRYGDDHLTNDPDITALDDGAGYDGSYIWFYVFYKKISNSWVRQTQYDNVTEDPSPNISGLISLDEVWTEDDFVSHLSDYEENDIIRLKWYFQKKSVAWILCYPTAEELAGHEQYSGEGQNADEWDLIDAGAADSYIYFSKYYTKVDTREWKNDSETPPSGVESITETNAFEYAYRNNHMRGFADGDWVKVPYYDYYKVEQIGSPHWVTVDYTSGDRYSISTYYSTTPASMADGNTVGEYAVVGGTKTSYIDGTWTTYSESIIVLDYSQMKFHYWSGSLEKAVTSKHADAHIESDIFRDCRNLTEVKYLSGNVTGFRDHKISEGYNTDNNTSLKDNGSLSVVLGKDVTQIDNDAFLRCDVLTSLTFSTDPDYGGYTGSESNPPYPKELTIGNSAFEECANLSGIVIPNRVTSIGNSAFKKAGNRGVTDGQAEADDYEPSTEFEVTFERRNHLDADGDHPVAIDCDFPLTIGNSAFEQCYNLQSLSLPIRLETMGAAAFKNTKGLTTLEMRETTNASYTPAEGHHLLLTIPTEAFQGSHVTAVTVPMSVTLIEDAAFGATNHLATITFQSQKDASGNDVAGQPSLTIKSGAFARGNENIIPNLHVYVDIDPTKRMIICEYNAFNFTQMQGQTDTKNERRGTLHFREDYWDYYQGNWKRGLSFSQTNLNAFKDGYTDGDKCMGKYNGDVSDINSTTGKYEYCEVGKEDGEYTPGNGWQMFAGTSTGIDLIIPSGTFIRTYCTNKTYEIPKVHVNNELTYLVSVYRIINFSDGYNESDPNADINSAEQAAAASRSATALLVRNISSSGEFAGEPCYIPKNTGLIMVGNVDAGSGYLTYFKDRDESSDEPTYTYQQDVSETSTVNLLEPTGDGITPIVVNPTEPYPIWSIDSEPANNYRIFGLAALQVEGVSKYSFGRMRKNQTMPENRAYLKLPVSLFHWANERVGTGPTYNDTPSSDSRLSLLFSDEVDNNELTGIAAMRGNTVGNGNYYTIQGVKVTRPQGKGLFIHNGKKIIIK